MNLTRMASFIVATLILCSSLWAAGNDWELVPGVRAGWITANTTIADIQEKVGPQNFIRTGVGPEAAEKGVVIYPNDPTKKADIGTTIINGREVPIWMMLGQADDGQTSLWHFKNGITLGTTMDQLNKINKQNVTYSNPGPGTCISGVYDFHGGELSKSKGYELQGGDAVCKLTVYLMTWSTSTKRYEPLADKQ